MALFKIFRGAENELNSISMHEGYAYFCKDTGNMFIDISNNAGDRVQVNAYAAKELIKYNSDGTIAKEIDIDDLFLKDMIAEVKNGGTGANTLTVNALLIGNGTNPIKMVSIADGSLVVGDSTDGVKGISIGDGELVVKDATNGITGIKGTGILMSLTAGAPAFGTATVPVGGTGKTTFTNGAILKGNDINPIGEVEGAPGVLYEISANAPQFGTAPLQVGGTGATDAAGARTNLDVYSKNEVDTSIETTTSICYTVTLYASGWSASGDKFIYNYANTDLVAKVPPVITYTSNLDEYSKIEKAEATANTGIVFTTDTKPTADIGIIITDVK